MSPVEDAEHPGIDPTGAGAGRIADHTLSRGPPKARRLVALAISAKATAPIMATPSIRRSRSEEHTSELKSLMRISYAVFCLKNKKNTIQETANTRTNI